MIGDGADGEAEENIVAIEMKLLADCVGTVKMRFGDDEDPVSSFEEFSQYDETRV